MRAPKIERLEVSAYKVPTESKESDGTLEWDSTVLVLVEASAGSQTGVGWSYADASTARMVRDTLAEQVKGKSAYDVARCWQAMVDRIRNYGRPGVASMAISAVDTALWDLKARLLDLPLVSLFGQVHEAIGLYGSGGFTSYSIGELQKQLGGWAKQGFTRVKMKVGREPAADPDRVRAAREAIGAKVELFVDANGAYDRKLALWEAERFAAAGVSWFEEPVSSDDLAGLHMLRDRAPAGMAIAAGEYGYDLPYFERMLAAESVDVLQADATRCGGFTAMLRVGALCEARCMPLSAHCAPGLHAHVACAIPQMKHIEFFFDHARLENMLFDGTLQPEHGRLRPDLSRPGHGMTFKKKDAQKFAL
jgi:L-alanine-DL-glutamate epimerase-like enolase superfamily enzyme